MKSNLKDICCDPKLFARVTLRDSIPLLLGLASMFFIKWLDIEIHGPDHVVQGPNNSRLFEESDVVGSFVLLLSFHLIDRLLEWKWRSNPYDIYEEIASSDNRFNLSM